MGYHSGMAFQPPRGIAPELLVSQVRNTAPYLFDPAWSAQHPELPLNPLFQPTEGLSHFEYFRLCLTSHLLSCATPVPTDVDLQIRSKLWHEKLPVETTLQMANLVLDCRKWDLRAVSQRHIFGSSGSPWAAEVLSGHLGEWFTVAAAAYGALSRCQDPLVTPTKQAIFEAISDEVHRHSEIFASLWAAQDGLGCLKASAQIAHNLGDLDRVMDLWELSSVDPLRLQFYKLTSHALDHQQKLRYRGRLWVAGELYKSEIGGSAMALENHRHFALRKPRVLRQSREFLIPIGPFFDAWGEGLARSLTDQPSELLEVVQALIQGWQRLEKTVGYGRALVGIFKELPELRDEAAGLAPQLKVKRNRRLLEVSQEAFEAQWNSEALRKMEEIPSRL